eukprot:TRINITY_DN12223_c0_g1_i3.p1 TRINITY_DN12223_c0_g1~~TRINITY_DN12223_c0_g1_i3.p1  ORF type:complete len:436 (+),score=68.76 TRINITY_DN12223_c0_g1_i3:1029-2336(+)
MPPISNATSEVPAKCKAGFYSKPGEVEMQMIDSPTLDGCIDGTVLLQGLYTTICGSDMLYVHQPRDIDHCCGASVHEVVARVLDVEGDDWHGLHKDQIVLALPSNYMTSGIFRDVPEPEAQKLREGIPLTGGKYPHVFLANCVQSAMALNSYSEISPFILVSEEQSVCLLRATQTLAPLLICIIGLSEYFLSHASHCYAIPPRKEWAKGLEPHHFTAAQPLGTILWMMRQCPNLLHKNVVILGQGQNCQIATNLVASMGARKVIAMDVIQGRLDISKQMGATDLVQVDLNDRNKALDEVKAITKGKGADVVLEMVGHQESTINLCIDLVADSGIIVAFGVPGNHIYGEFAFATLFRKNARLFGSVFPCAHEDFPFAVELIAQGRVDVQPIFNTEPFEIDQAPTAFHRCIHEKETVMKVNIKLRRDAHELAEQYCV